MNSKDYYILIIVVVFLFIIVPTIIYCCSFHNKIKIKINDDEENNLLI